MENKKKKKNGLPFTRERIQIKELRVVAA